MMQAEVATLAGDVPASLRQVLDQQITRLAPALQRVMEVASVAAFVSRRRSGGGPGHGGSRGGGAV